MAAKLVLSRAQILNFRRRASSLDDRLPAGGASLRKAAWAGLQDSSPRAALLSIHARVAGTRPDTWEDPSLVQLWGPRFSDYVVAADDLAVFSLGRMPIGEAGRRRAESTAESLHRFLKGRRMAFGEAGRAMGVVHNSLRYAAATGRVLLRWDGSRQPVVWTVAAPEMEAEEARRELARRFLHILGPGIPSSFSKWAGIGGPMAAAIFKELQDETIAVRTPAGDRLILARDEASYRLPPGPAAPARLLPSGDTYFLAWGADREILVPEPEFRKQLWTSRVWPGALLVDGQVAGVWRRAGGNVAIETWRRLTKSESEAVEQEIVSFPLPGLEIR